MISNPQSVAAGNSSSKNPYARSLMMITSLFFLFGFITCMNDILVPHLKQAFTLNYTQAILIQFAFFSSYFVVSIPSSKFCENFGYQRGLYTGLAITAVGAFGFLASANFVSFPLFLLSFFVLAAGITLIQVAANPYVTLLGNPETSSARLTLVQAFNSLGTTVAPLIGSYLILSTTSIDSVKTPYLVIALALVGLAVFVAMAKFPSFKSEKTEDAPWSEIFANRRLVMGCFAIFAYVGAEVAIGSFLVNYLGTSHVMGFDAETAARYVAFYWGGAMVGRFLGTPLLAKFRPGAVLQAFATGTMVMVALSVFGTGEFAMWTILAVGLFNSIMFPTIFSESIAGMKRGTEKASGLLCTSIVGGAIIPLIQGVLADRMELRWSYFLPIICYAYIWMFAGYVRAKFPVKSGATASATAATA
ncbi:MAG: sugar MFS transporter [Bdellovibrionales bacterium]|nr:sugar MFS transporter [Bdellovibrionales bacterium]